jgi:hypothetical protein
MASTFTYLDVLTRVASYNPRATEDALSIFAVNDALGLLWNAYHFSFTKAELPPFWLVGGEQDYGNLVAAVPADFKSIISAEMIDTDTAPFYRIPLIPKRDAPRTGRQDTPEIIAYVPEVDAFRVHPAPPYGYGPGKWIVNGVYKRHFTKITRDTLISTLPWDDEWFPVFCAALEWGLLPHKGQEKAMARQYALALVADMAQKSGLDESDPVGVAPREPLVRRW